jgi:hypothetical protein
VSLTLAFVERGRAGLVSTDPPGANLDYLWIAEHTPEPVEGMAPTMSECQIPQPFGARSAGDDTCATLHNNLYAGRVIWLDRCHKFEIDEV